MSVLFSKVSEVCERFVYLSDSIVQPYSNLTYSWKDRMRYRKAASNQSVAGKQSRLELSDRLHRMTSGSGKIKTSIYAGQIARAGWMYQMEPVTATTVHSLPN